MYTASTGEIHPWLNQPDSVMYDKKRTKCGGHCIYDLFNGIKKNHPIIIGEPGTQHILNLDIQNIFNIYPWRRCYFKFRKTIGIYDKRHVMKNRWSNSFIDLFWRRQSVYCVGCRVLTFAICTSLCTGNFTNIEEKIKTTAYASHI